MEQAHSKETEGLWDWNLVTNRVHFSPRWLSLMGCDNHEPCHTPDVWLERVHPDDLSKLLLEIETVRADGAEFAFRHRLRHQDGLYRWMACRGTVVRNGQRKAIRLTGAHWDVTADKVADPATGLPNNLLLLDRVSHAIQRARRHGDFCFAVLLLDVRRIGVAEALKLGGGVPLLTAVARRLETCLRIRDATLSNDLVARLDGNQFAILLEGLKEMRDAKVVADRILSDLQAPFALNGSQVFVFVSVGVAVSATGYTRAEDMVRDAETAAHRARVLGGSQSEVFDTAVLRSEETERQLEGDLLEALERRQFHLVYQPIVELASSQIIGFEALVRWQHPSLGIISPSDFIPLAERTGFIVPLGNWIVREACLQLRAWHDRLPSARNVWMSVNLSGVQLKHPALTEEIADTLRDVGLDPCSLVLELTEGVAIDNPSAIKTVLMQLRALGVRISIDDFGTGYSSLAYLRQLPVDVLKVDRSFVHGMEKDDDTAVIIRTLTAMAQQLGLKVVVEGIENEEQLTRLRGLHCDSVQGFLFAKPLEANTALDVLTGRSLRPSGMSDNQTVPLMQADQRLTTPVGSTLAASLKRRSLAAAVVLLGFIGVAGWFTDGFRVAFGSSASLSTNNRRQSLAKAESSPRTMDVVAGDSGLRSPSPPQSPSQPSNEKVSSAGTPGVVAASSTPAASIAPVPLAPETARPKLISLHVQHLHRLGNCFGRLVASSGGLEFMPDDQRHIDAFALKYHDFLASLAESTLVIKSHTKTYRFKTVAVAEKGEQASQLADFVASMDRFR